MGKVYKKVLLIDDSEVDNFMNEKLIKHLGFAKEVVLKDSASSALEYLSTEKEDAMPELIFLDIMMPLMDGFTFLEELDKKEEHVKNCCKVIMLSSSESFKDLNRANKSIYVYKFLNKPLTEANLNAINI